MKDNCCQQGCCDNIHTHEHQAPSGEYNFNDYSEKMPDLLFRYDQTYYPCDEDLPDPQVDPILPGANVPLQKVGIAPVDFPIQVRRRDGSTQTLQAQASLYCSLDDPDAKGLNLSRLYLLMHEKIKDHLTIDGIRSVLEVMANKQGSDNAYCKLRFRYPWTQKALRTRQPLNAWEEDHGEFETLSNGEKISLRKMEGHIAYDVVIEGRFHRHEEQQFQFFLTTDYTYSSTCPCSFELAHTATEMRNAAANAHSQRSIMRTTVQFDPSDFIWIEDMIELHRQYIPTEVQIVVKRRDEQAFAELNGSNLLFSEDAVRLMYGALDEWYEQGRISDFTISTSHEESLHPWDAISVVWKHSDVAPKG
jgi:GTP cyclohydrolase I